MVKRFLIGNGRRRRPRPGDGVGRGPLVAGKRADGLSRRFLFEDDVLLVLGLILGVLALGLGIALALLPILT
jgi:hypothetical protein